MLCVKKKKLLSIVNKDDLLIKNTSTNDCTKANFYLFHAATTLKDLSTICELTKETDVVPDYMTLVSFREEDVNREKNRIFEFLIEEGHLEKATLLAKSLVLPVWKVSLSQVRLHQSASHVKFIVLTFS